MLRLVPIVCLFLLLRVPGFSQEILANGGFEDENICTEYQVNCSPEAWTTNKDGFGTYFKDVAGAHSGIRYVAIELGHTTKNFQRTFYRSQLLCGLRKDHRYRLSFFLKTPMIPADSVGVLFTDYDFQFSKQKLHRLLPDMFIQPASGHLTTDSIWQEISMNYTARGNESFMTIASFAKRDLKDGNASFNTGGHFFIFLDDVSLVPLDPREHLCGDAEMNRQTIYEQDERHEYMRLKVRQNNDDPPKLVLQPLPVLTVDTLVLPDVLFASGRSDLKSESDALLDQFCAQIRGRMIDSIVVEGHTDNTGTLAINEKLSLARAESVKDALKKRLPRFPPPIITRGLADRRPIGANTTVAGRRQNRRVELFVYMVE